MRQQFPIANEEIKSHQYDYDHFSFECLGTFK